MDVATKDTSNQKYHHCNPGSIRLHIQHHQGKHNALPWWQRWQVVPKVASDYDILLANFKMELKAGCCSKRIGIRFDLDKLREPEIESGVPDSDWWKVCSPQSD